MLEQVLQHLNNWFLVPDGVHSGTFEIKGGSIALPFLSVGQYFRIIGSVFNDGLHQYPANNLVDETFEGAVWALAVPNAVVALSEEMEAWQEKNEAASSGPYQSESFGGYSYTRATGENGKTLTVFDVFAEKLNPYRKAGGNYVYAEPNPHMTPPLPRKDNPWR